MSYNLKAKRKSDGKIFEYIKTSDGIHRVALNETTTHVSTTEDFMKEYEVISDTQEDKAISYPTEGEALEWEQKKEDKGWREHDILNSEFALCQDIRTLRPGLIKLIERVQTQAYARGQADAYRESASVARKERYFSEDDSFTKTTLTEVADTLVKEAGENIAQAIEKLSSNKE